MIHHAKKISIHALLAESDSRLESIKDSLSNISIHALLAESDLTVAAHFGRRKLFLSTLSLRRATQAAYFFLAAGIISIHALLAESDPEYFLTWHCIREFLSTLSLRRATSIIDIINNVINYFYPRSPCGERPRRIAAE